MSQSELLKISYKDAKNSIHLTNYADTLVFREDEAGKTILTAIRFGGYPEQVRATVKGSRVSMKTVLGVGAWLLALVLNGIGLFALDGYNPGYALLGLGLGGGGVGFALVKMQLTRRKATNPVAAPEKSNAGGDM